MLYRSLKLIIFSSIFATNSICISMDNESTKTKGLHLSIGREPDKIITFQGQEKYLMNLIIACEYDHNHPFSVTPIIRKTDNKFHHTGEIADLNEQDFKDIHNKNYIYLDNHTQKKTRLYGNQIVPVSLLILGTKDKESCLQKFKPIIKSKFIKIPK